MIGSVHSDWRLFNAHVALSPRLRMLQQALQQGAADALPTFWQIIARNGTPLLEPIPNDRNAEFTYAPTFVDFLTQELLPWVRTHYQVTSDPQQTIIGGASFGGFSAIR